MTTTNGKGKGVPQPALLCGGGENLGGCLAKGQRKGLAQGGEEGGKGGGAPACLGALGGARMEHDKGGSDGQVGGECEQVEEVAVVACCCCFWGHGIGQGWAGRFFFFFWLGWAHVVARQRAYRSTAGSEELQLVAVVVAADSLATTRARARFSACSLSLCCLSA